MKLVIADDNAKFRNRLASNLSKTEGINIVGEAGDVAESIAVIQRTKPDVAILDLHMPGGNGFHVLQAVKGSGSAPIFIMLTVGSKREYQTLSYLAGADYFFEKSSEMQNMFNLLKSMVCQGNRGKKARSHGKESNGAL